MTISKEALQLIRDADECFDWLVRGCGECGCGDCRQCFSDEVATRLMAFVKDADSKGLWYGMPPKSND